MLRPVAVLCALLCAVWTSASQTQPSTSQRQKVRTFHSAAEFDRVTGGTVRIERGLRSLRY